ncbi:MAG: triose-phosphate isomerase, partial [Clostridia bacterium]|nr:triose-phosphate isomerase [Clostridia bacterium]
DIAVAKKALEGSNIGLGAQNLHFEDKGAFTGEISAPMLVEAGVQYVIIGHSERRQYFAETDETVNKKMHKAISAGLIPIVCVGETLEQREEGVTETFVRGQVKAAYAGIAAEDVEKTVIAYEPIWAIGTGKTATSEQANEVIAFIRDEIAKIYDAETAAKLRIQYGGSMNPKNASELMAMPEIDGGLIGGASLKAEDFSKVVHF